MDRFFVKIPKASLKNLPLFGYDKIAEETEGFWYKTPWGDRMWVEKDDPRILVEDINDALQLKAQAILTLSK